MNRHRILSMILAAVALAVTLWCTVHWWPTTQPDVDFDHAEPASNKSSALIRLSEAKEAVARIRTQEVTRRSFKLTRTLPARFAYDDRRHVAVRAATDGVIESVFVKPGDVLEAGQRLAVLRSPAVGDARNQVLRRQTEWELAEAECRRQTKIREGVGELVAAIREEKPVPEIQSQLDDAVLGTYRSELLIAYSRMTLATQLSASAADSAGAISGRVIRQRQNELQQAQAELDAAIEEALFVTQQTQKAATSEAETARRGLIIAQQSLATLLATRGDRFSGLDVSPNETNLARLEIIAPLSGTLERRIYSATERVTAGAEMFIIADTSKLWVEADIRGRDWDAIRASEGDPVRITTPADPHNELLGTVHYVGREVDPASGAVPLVAEVANPENGYRPGLFARLEVPIDQVDAVLAVPDSSLCDLDGQTSVFVQQGNGFQPVAVDVGRRSAELVEIRSGLREGQQVVIAGTFILKSELLLEGGE